MGIDPDFQQIRPHLAVLRFPAASLEAVFTRCPNCSAFLTLLQPDAELPDRLIGACEQCKHWYLIDVLPDVSEGTMVRLPDVQVIRNLSRTNPSAGISLRDGDPDADSPDRMGREDVPEP
jgi:hypothetical protein